MAKRKRLSAPNPEAMAGPLTEPPMSPAPIAGVAAEAATTAALDEMAEALQSARREGRMILSLPLEQVETGYLVRDRIAADDEAMEALKSSIRARGQQVPVEVTELEKGRYGLISGWRRCEALRQLAGEDAGFGEVKVILRRPEDASDAYLAMVEENEIRANLSHYERARIVVKSTLNGAFETEQEALRHLFQSGSRARRSKIGTFLHIVHALDDVLRFPEAIPERLGLRLARALQDFPGLGARMAGALRKAAPRTAEAEAACLLATLPKPVSKKAKTAAERAGEIVYPCKGVEVRTGADGSLTVSGKAVNAVLRQRLLDWLKVQG